MDGGLLDTLRRDMAANSGNTKGRLIVGCFRLAAALKRQGSAGPLRRLLCALPLGLYTLLFDYVMGVHLPAGLCAGPGLRVFHGQGLVVHEGARLGAGVTLRHCTTIGVRGGADGTAASPVLEDGVDVGAHSVILGGVRVGAGAVIGAGAVVVKDIPPGATAVGNPARVLLRS